MKELKGGLYLVVDPAMEENTLLINVSKALEGGVDVLQIWNNWSGVQNKSAVIAAICSLAHQHNVPVIINEEWELLMHSNIDGVHFDNPPEDLSIIRTRIGRDFISGITCGNDLGRIKWATDNGFSYISFCSMFPSPLAGVCEIVKPETVTRARQMTTLPSQFSVQ